MAEITENIPVRKNASVMISYSRKDLAFVRKLFEGLLAQGFAKEDIWVDWEGIPLTADWMAEITEGIHSANAFIFVISPDSLTSEVCAKEIAIAVEGNKRFIPILHRDPAKGTALPAKISSHNWVFMRDEPELEKNLPPLVEALNTDLDWLAQHTRLLNRALEWEKKGHNDSYLVRGSDLQEAQSFIELGATGKEPPPTALHVEYVQAARKYAAVIRRRNRIIAAVVGVALLVLSVFSLIQWGNALVQRDRADANANTAIANEQIAHTQEAIAIDAKAQAEREARVANAQALAAEAFNQKDNDSQLALMLSLLSIQETEVDGIVLPESKSALFASLNSPNVLYTFPQSRGVVWAVAIDPNGMYAASCDEMGVSIWNLKTRELVRLIEVGSITNGLDFSPDGTRLGIAGDTAKVVDVESGETVFELQGHEGHVNDIDFSPDGKLITTAGSDSTIKLWFADQGTLRTTLFDHQAEVRAVEFGPDSSLLVSGSYDDTAILWDVTDEGVNLIRILRPDGLNGNGFVQSVAFNATGNEILTGGDQTTVVWSVFEDKEIHRLRGNRSVVYEVVFAPDGLTMLTASSVVKIWDYFYGIERYNLSSHRGEVSSATFSPDGNYILTGSWDKTVKLWAANLLIDTLKMKENISRKLDAQYSYDGKWIAVADEDGTVLVYDTQTGEVVDQQATDSAINAVSFDPQNSERFVTGDDNGQIIVWRMGSNEPALVIAAHEAEVASAVFSPDGSKILSSGSDHTAKVWDAQNGNHLSVLEHDGITVYDARFSDDGLRIVTANDINIAQIWDAQSGENLLTLAGHTDYVLTATFSHDGNYVYTGSYDNTIKKWDAQTGELLQTFAGHTGRVNDLDISPNDTLLVSGSTDTTVKVWDLKTGKEIFNYLGNNEETNSVAFNLDGSRVLTSSSDETTKEFSIDYEDLLLVAQQYELRPLTLEECESFLSRDDCSLHLFGGDQTNVALPATPIPESPAVPTTTMVVDPPTAVPAQATPTAVSPDTPTAESQASPATGFFYTEEFEGDVHSWQLFMASGLESQVNAALVNGAFAIQLSPHEDKLPWALFINDPFSYTDVRIDAVVTNNGNNANGVSLVCRHSDAGWYEFLVSNAQLYAIYAYDSLGSVQPGYFELAAGGSPAVTAGHTTNVYTAICSGNELTLLVNDTVVKTIIDTRYNFTEGKIGVGVSSPQLLPVDVQIESVTVSEP